ncbi:MAG TPA: Gfo/Idh/MocA family oxidoreductase [Propionicimonas sp.]|jgi:predicted dehydrogenase|uniref:Gfo/Idh/MocA family protein n=1 Tax=Propionicimonas sp. TaxID=1955623 RepID=UPI002F410B3E
MTQPGDVRLAVGMVGGGPGSNIGIAHRTGLLLDDKYRLVAGSFARDPARSAAMAAQLGLDADRSYTDFRTMAVAEAARPDGIDLVVVATPNDSHVDIVTAFLEAGIAVACEKPLATDSIGAARLVELAAAKDQVLAVAHCYSAYAMVRHAARLVRDGALGDLRFVDVEHASGWASTLLESGEHKQAGWRMDPAVAGYASVVADIGIHAFHLARYITGLEAEEVSAQLSTLVPGRRVADNATVALRLTGGVPGRLWASMAATGQAHGLRIRVFGEHASIEWTHEDPQHLVLRRANGEEVRYTQGMAGLSEDEARLNRVGMGHAEGFIEAFANYYSDIAEELFARRAGVPVVHRELSYPTGIDGLIGIQFVEAVSTSHAANSAWVRPVSKKAGQ